MRVGELSRRSGVSVASIKYYLREGLLPAGERSSPNQASYDDGHLRRLRMIRALIDVGGLSVVATRDVLAAVDDPELPLFEALGRASGTTTDAPAPEEEPDEAWEAAERMLAAHVDERGWQVSAQNPAWANAVGVLATYVRLGDGDLANQLGLYMRTMEEVAEREVAAVVNRGDRARTVEGVVVGTVLGDTLIAAVRRLAQQHQSLRLLGEAPTNPRV
ncbi:MerR family transcriptional regulator [Actinomycetospora corticicola]|uniref:DNA-binding transcriptional MerR regulator n=2 Tax=Actinomycetospora corticicola TaxID=663602 RepID=A0A7Y9J7E2_9PSEU|nr:MerR family transcriptional regulator [Actinomycetospora corticicola]NYD37941.1 DNA-binding transcriptional MerR regulator [Actinomycetospora corticicola]